MHDITAAAGLDIAGLVAEEAWMTAAKALRGADTALDIVVFDRAGGLIGRSRTRPASACADDR